MELFKSKQNVFEISPFKYAANVYGEHYSIPAFQREFVWDKKKDNILGLLDSIYKGYSIGTIVFWESNMTNISRSKDNLNAQEKNGTLTFVLDGQQRTLSMLSLFSNHEVVDIGLKDIYIKYSAKAKSLKFVKKSEIYESSIYMSFKEYKNKIMFNGIGRSDFYGHFQKLGYGHEKIEAFKGELEKFENNYKGKDLLIGYKIHIGKNDMNKAIEQFEKINDTGTKLSPFQILDAVAFTTNFKLADQYKSFIGKFDGIVSNSKFTGEAEKIILNSYKLIKNYKIDRKNPSLSFNSIAHYERADSEILNDVLKYFKSGLAELKNIGLSSIREVPYTHNLVAYIFMKSEYPSEMLEMTDKELLYSVMFQTGIMKRYDKSASQRLVADIQRIITAVTTNTSITLREKNTIFRLYSTDIHNTSYKSLKAVEKAIILYWITMLKPKDFVTKEAVKLDNIYNKSTNLDHIFPKSKRRGYADMININSFANIAILEAKTNQTKNDKDPSIFFTPFKHDKYEDIYQSQSIHLDAYHAALKDDAPTFVEVRAKDIAEELNVHLSDLENGRI